MRKAFAGLATLFMLTLVAQFYFAASGAFNTAPNDESFAMHRAWGYLVFLVAIVMTIVAALARMPRRLVGMTGLVVGLIVLQVVIAEIATAFGDTGESATAGQLVFGLHAVNGLAIVAVAARIIRQARALSRSTVAHGRAGAGSDAAGSAAASRSARQAP